MSKSILHTLKFNLAIIDDHDCVLQGASTYLKKTFINANIQTFTKGTDFLEHLDARAIDICIVDLELQDTEGIKVIKTIKKRRSDIKVIVHTMHDEPWVIKEVMDQNVESIVLKNSKLDMLCKAVEAVLEGQKFYCQKMKEKKEEHKDGSGGSFILSEPLNDTDKQIIILIAKSQTYKKIAKETGYSEHTIKSYKKDLLRKFQVHSGAELVAKAILYGFIDKKDLL